MKKVMMLAFCLTLNSAYAKIDLAPLKSRGISSIHQQSKLWDNGQTLNILFLSGTKEQKDKVRKVAPQWTNYANLKFKFFNKGEIKKRHSHIKIHFDGKCKGNWSKVGKDSKSSSHSMCLFNTNNNTILHEFGHALGFRHEHFHPDFSRMLNNNFLEECSKYNKWSKSKCRFNYFSDNKYSIVGEYDKYSVMHYDIPSSYLRDEFSEDLFGPLGILSLGDRKTIADLYPNNPNKLNIEEDFFIEINKMLINHSCKIIDFHETPNVEGTTIDQCEEGQRFAIFNQSINGDSLVWRLYAYRSNCYSNIYNAIRDLSTMNFCKSNQEKIDDFLKKQKAQQDSQPEQESEKED